MTASVSWVKTIVGAAAATRRRTSKKAAGWANRWPPKMEAFLCPAVGMATLLFLYFVLHNHVILFVTAKAAHVFGIELLIYEFAMARTCANLSLKAQALTAIFLAIRSYCSWVVENDIHTFLDIAALGATLMAIYMMCFELKPTYTEDKDDFPMMYVVVPCALMALVVHPLIPHSVFNSICWAFSVYMEAVSMLPQLRLLQKQKVVEPLTAHYVFALVLARFLSCAHWVLGGSLLTRLGYGLWPNMILLSEVVQTFILAIYCYYYAKGFVVDGQPVLRVLADVV